MKFILFYTFISFIICYIIVRINYKLRHKFWSEQPVSNNIYFQFYEGIIDDKIKKPLKINNNYSLIEWDISKITPQNMKLLKQFINSNYYQDKKYKYVYSDKQLAFLFNKSNKNIKIMTINDKTKIIGCITSRINKVRLNNNIINIGYIDFLCTDQKYRNQKLAPILISNIRYINNLEGIQSFIFKIEKYKLPFNYLSKLNYYQLDLKNTNPIDIDIKNKNIFIMKEEDLKKVFKFFCDNIKKSKLQPVYSYEEFENIFLPNKNKNIINYIQKNNLTNDIEALILLSIQTINIENKTYNAVEIIYLLSDNTINMIDFINNVINNLKLKFDYLIFLDNTCNKNIIDKYNCEKGLPCYYQLYNYNVNYIINPEEITLNYL